MNPQFNQMNQRMIKSPNRIDMNGRNFSETNDNMNQNMMNYKNSIETEEETNNDSNFIYNNRNPNLISNTQNIIGRNEFMKTQITINNYQKLIQDLQYSNALLNKKNLSLESEMESLKTKYNDTKNDLNDINKHISICKENQEKIIFDLIERNNQLEALCKNNKNSNCVKIEEKSDKKSIKLKYFIFKMKQIFNVNKNNNLEANDKVKDEDYLNIITNNIIKMNEELNKHKNELEQKNVEINKLNNENQILKIKFRNLINKNKNISNYNFYSTATNYKRMKTPVCNNKLLKIGNDNISNLEFKDNLSSNKIQLPIFVSKYNSHSPSPLRNNFVNNLSKTRGPEKFNNMQTYFTENSNNNEASSNAPFNKKKKMKNSYSLNSIKFKSLGDFENNKNNYSHLPKTPFINQQYTNSKNCLQNLMNNVEQLENALKDSENMI